MTASRSQPCIRLEQAWTSRLVNISAALAVTRNFTSFASTNMASTPHKLVHWALDVSMSDFGSPFSAATSESSSTSSLQYINSQLIAHGFAQSPGLSLEGLAKDDADKVVKCLLGMLSQRIVSVA